MPYPIGTNKAEQIGIRYDGPIYALMKTFNGVNYSKGNPRIKGRYVSGGGWYMRKTETICESEPKPIWQKFTGKLYTGRFEVNSHWVFPNTQLPSNWDTDDYKNTQETALKNRGAEAWNALRPAKPSFDLGLNLLELKDLPGMLKQSLSLLMTRIRREQNLRRNNGSRLKKTGEWYLAIEFGWLPLLSGIKDFIQTQKKQQAIFSQIVRDSGRPVKRSRRLSDSQNDSSSVRTTFENVGNNLWPAFVTGAYHNSGLAYGDCTHTMSSKTWCEGRFRYYLPPGPMDVKWKKRIMRRIFGLRPTPSLVYNLMPWTWLADYFTTLGSFMQSVSSGVEDRLAADYFYIMKTIEWKTISTRFQSAWSNIEGTSYHPVGGTRTSTSTIKMRVAASPFGFGFKDSDLSLKQTAILGALGLSRLPTY